MRRRGQVGLELLLMLMLLRGYETGRVGRRIVDHRVDRRTELVEFRRFRRRLVVWLEIIVAVVEKLVRTWLGERLATAYRITPMRLTNNK